MPLSGRICQRRKTFSRRNSAASHASRVTTTPWDRPAAVTAFITTAMDATVASAPSLTGSVRPERSSIRPSPSVCHSTSTTEDGSRRSACCATATPPRARIAALARAASHGGSDTTQGTAAASPCAAHKRVANVREGPSDTVTRSVANIAAQPGRERHRL
jgi:hypothetical protein